jgi:hypothetical protein
MLTRCVRLIDCADVCATTGNVLSREVEFDPALAKAIVQACVAACRVCGDECERHAEHMEHCRVRVRGRVPSVRVRRATRC